MKTSLNVSKESKLKTGLKEPDYGTETNNNRTTISVKLKYYQIPYYHSELANRISSLAKNHLP